MKKSYISPKIEKKESQKSGYGLFAKKDIAKNEVVIDFSQGPGRFISNQEMEELYKKHYDYGIQTGDNMFFAATDDGELEAADFLNHSCDPNCGIKNFLMIVAMRDIKSGEEITFDYAMSESSDFSMPCACAALDCRKMITGNDWKMPKLQQKYKGYFSDYLQEKIDKLDKSK